jgi:dTDP-4-amino-4,6-dideoxygalactose transaminase
MTTDTLVTFNRPYLTGRELGYIAEAVANLHLSGNGPFTERCTRWLQERYGCDSALLTFSCTSALEMAMILLDLEPGDEVIVPSFTFVSTASAVAMRGAVPVFADVRPDTLNLDPEQVAGAITDRTRAIVPVHYAGVGCDMDALAAHGLPLVEDAAQAIEATWHGRPLGAIGDLGCLSFHETKNVTCGEGGALLVNRAAWSQRAEILQEKGTNRRQFHRGQVDKYTWVELGSSFLTSEINAAYLWAQLESAEEITARRLAVWHAYHDRLAGLEERGLLRRPVVPEGCAHNGHMYQVLLADREARDALIAGLRERGVQAVFHYVPLHSSPAGLRLGRAHGDLAVTDDVSARLVRLPMSAGLGEAEVERVVAAVQAELAG